MQTATALRAAAGTDAGLQRDVNQDRIHLDLARGVFLVVDGVGGHAAGGRAADIALTTVRSRLERETGPAVDRVRDAITIANNAIHSAAALRPEWNGMACVLTVVVVDDTRAVVGHVGDTRLYKLGADRIDKITRDHSPVGEREDSSELSELEAMHHPRRNEVYRDVGSDPHQPDDPDFIDACEIRVRAGRRPAALQRRTDRSRQLVVLARHRQAFCRSARPGGEGADRRRECRRRQGQHQRGLRGRGAVRAGRRLGGACGGRDHAAKRAPSGCRRGRDG